MVGLDLRHDPWSRIEVFILVGGAVSTLVLLLSVFEGKRATDVGKIHFVENEQPLISEVLEIKVE